MLQLDEELGKIFTSISFQKAETPELDLQGNPLYAFVATLTFNDQSVVCAVLPKEVTPAIFEMHSDMPWIPTPKKEFELNREYGRYLTLNKFCGFEFGSMESVSDISKLPTPLPNFVSDLQSFVNSSPSDTPAQEIHALYSDSGIGIESVDGNPPA